MDEWEATWLLWGHSGSVQDVQMVREINFYIIEDVSHMHTPLCNKPEDNDSYVASPYAVSSVYVCVCVWTKFELKLF